MTIWLAGLPKFQNFENKDFQIPHGWTLLKRKRQLRLKLLEDVVAEFNVFKLTPKNPEYDKFWMPGVQNSGMTDEIQTEINRVLCQSVVQTSHVDCNVTLLWYLAEGVAPDVHCPQESHDKIRPPITTLQQVNVLRALWLTRQAA